MTITRGRGRPTKTNQTGSAHTAASRLKRIAKPTLDSASVNSANVRIATRLSYEAITGRTWKEIKDEYNFKDDESQAVYASLFYHPDCGASPSPGYTEGKVSCSGCAYSMASDRSEYLGVVLAKSDFRVRVNAHTFLY